MTIRTILMEPPWRMCSGGKSSINVHYQYPLQSQQEIKETVDQWLAQYDIAEEAHVYIWVINSFKTGECRGILDGVELCEHIGFRPITLIPWVKSNVGNPTPYGMRCVEHCLFGVRNRPGRDQGCRLDRRNNSQQHEHKRRLSYPSQGQTFKETRDIL